MKIFLVGGAVRDEILNIQSVEKDWVVIGASEKEMLQKGFISVGKSFPVFLHPDTKEEYALARKEVKTGLGHKDFEFDVNKEITIEEDLLRRDLTINAIAKTDAGEIIDPYGGLQDIENKVLRHISDAFKEDPLRVFRVARFYTYLSKFDFKIYEETISFMKEICESGELSNLSFERIWMETQKCLSMKNSHLYFEILNEIGALSTFTSEIKKFSKNIISLKGKKENLLSDEEKWALLTLNIKLNKKVKVPNRFKKYSNHLSTFVNTLNGEISSKLVLEALMKIDAFRDKDRANKIYNLYKLVANENEIMNNLDFFLLLDKLTKVKPKKIKDKNSKLIKQEIFDKRILLIEEFIYE